MSRQTPAAYRVHNVLVNASLATEVFSGHAGEAALTRCELRATVNPDQELHAVVAQSLVTPL